ncbi:MAG: hypothetical protein C4523_12200, partial [Myxococcales bacterium]
DGDADDDSGWDQDADTEPEREIEIDEDASPDGDADADPSLEDEAEESLDSDGDAEPELTAQFVIEGHVYSNGRLDEHGYQDYSGAAIELEGYGVVTETERDGSFRTPPLDVCRDGDTHERAITLHAPPDEGYVTDLHGGVFDCSAPGTKSYGYMYLAQGELVLDKLAYHSPPSTTALDEGFALIYNYPNWLLAQADGIVWTPIQAYSVVVSKMLESALYVKNNFYDDALYGFNWRTEENKFFRNIGTDGSLKISKNGRWLLRILYPNMSNEVVSIVVYDLSTMNVIGELSNVSFYKYGFSTDEHWVWWVDTIHGYFNLLNLHDGSVETITFVSLSLQPDRRNINFSPNGKYVLLNVDSGGFGGGFVYVPLDNPMEAACPDFGEDHRYIGIDSISQNGKFVIATYRDADNDRYLDSVLDFERMLHTDMPEEDIECEFSPITDMLLCFGSTDIYRFNRESMSLERIAADIQKWGPDRIYFSDGEHLLFQGKYSGVVTKLKLSPPYESILLVSGLKFSSLYLSPDERWLTLFPSADGDYRILRISIDGGEMETAFASPWPVWPRGTLFGGRYLVVDSGSFDSLVPLMPGLKDRTLGVYQARYVAVTDRAAYGIQHNGRGMDPSQQNRAYIYRFTDPNLEPETDGDVSGVGSGE